MTPGPPALNFRLGSIPDCVADRRADATRLHRRALKRSIPHPDQPRVIARTIDRAASRATRRDPHYRSGGRGAEGGDPEAHPTRESVRNREAPAREPGPCLCTWPPTGRCRGLARSGSQSGQGRLMLVDARAIVSILAEEESAAAYDHANLASDR